MTIIEKLSHKHCWRLSSDIRTKIIYTEDELKKQIEICKALKVNFKIEKLW